ncbi:VanZ family protein [Rhizobium leguminosarum bv. viciae]|uniref:VanZ family protein n=1 Tax=Rhizobium leguminosarum bv. viciae TaxID=387 RepID=A0A4R0BSF0_RHILV|nr:VanZ family protein [Rhizobium leguminosarum]ASR06786.1 VanZ family protein [Rhizobium leguminosarum bv. viciae]MBY5772149.1 VanZ family protein [Rhizobium leguminosarum]MBY5779194.1 VanZ family protein [Rhizobium leguminosarum]MBY5793044.1 VanZ family protein [Rhizobium leguminosarum]NKM44153.1 VanZ family protein [Rhizobium leguminosarum bv. viciae]
MMIFKFARPLAWLLLALILFVTVSPIGLRPETVTTVDTDRGGAYVLVGLAFALAYPKQWKMVAVLLIAGAVAIEYLQYFAPTRHPRLHDAGIKAAGAALGLLAGWLINRWRETKAPDTLPLTER